MDATVRFDRFELHPGERRLLRDGQEVPIRGRAFDVLAVLAERPGKLISKSELLERVWPGLVVEEGNIAAQIAAVRKALAGDLITTVPGHGYRLAIETGPRAEAPATAPEAPADKPHLFGRDDDLARLHQALRHAGCVTLVGPGGVGKTSLAKAVADSFAPAYWCDLAALTQASQLLPALYRTLGRIPGQADDEVAALVGPLPAGTLLVLDNAEHLVDAVAGRVGQLLTAAPGLRLLVTSQLPLAVHGEHVERLGPLQLPAPGLSDELLLKVGSVALFVDRVHAADSRGVIGPQALPLVAQVCTELDGIPLALEMAAACVPTLGLRSVAEGLSERFGMLRRGHRGAAPRHRTLHAALDWSFGCWRRTSSACSARSACSMAGSRSSWPWRSPAAPRRNRAGK